MTCSTVQLKVPDALWIDTTEDAGRLARKHDLSLLIGGYTHQNGIIDEKFRKSFPLTKVNDEYRMTLDEFLDRFDYLAQAIEAVDEAARKDFKLAAFS